MTQIKTNRLILRDFTIEDYEGVHAYASDPIVCRYVDFGPNSPDDTKNFINKCLEEQSEHPRLNYNFAVVHPNYGVIGGCRIRVRNATNRNASIGYVLNRNYWGKDFGTEIAGKLIEFGFKDLNMHRITAMCDPQNIASWKVMEKNGMMREGLLRQNQLIRGEWRDSYIYSLLFPEYQVKSAE
jgi:RimJ/RimL family protein N-acetyltransferase